MDLMKELEREENELLKLAQESKEYILKELKKIKRKGMSKLINALEEGELSHFWDAPASASHHLNVPHGLCIHTALVLKKGLELYPALGKNVGVKRQSVVIATTLHDLAKGNNQGRNEYLESPLNKNGTRKAKPYFVNKDIPTIDHSIRSVFIAQQYIKLEDDEITAITYHDGSWANHWRSYMNSCEPLWQITHTADYHCARFIEPELTERLRQYV